MSNRPHPFHRSAPLCAAILLGGALAAQQPAFRSPGLSSYSLGGQTTRFSNEFNPAFGGVIDLFADYLDDDREDGYDLEFRLFELNAAAYIDPKAWAYVALVSEGGEAPTVEEAAIHYLGLEGNSTVKAGRFFLDFGKQMQHHLEELRTLERPLVLREYLGEELGGTGVQLDHWFAVGENTPVRFSLGAFANLLGEGHDHGDDEPEPEAAVKDRKDIDELAFTARLTAMTDVGETGLLQVGASARYVPAFAFRFDTLEEDDLSNVVYGLDLTFGRSDDTGQRNFTAGGELLLFDGDLSAEVDDPLAPTTLTVTSDSAAGFLAFADYAWNTRDSAGIQYSQADLAEDPGATAGELDLYVTRHFTEYRRARLGVTVGDSDLDGDSLRVYLQFTNFFGTHSHGLNW